MARDLKDLCGVDFPLFAFSHCRDVVAAVSRAGGFGVLGGVAFTPESLDVELKWIDDNCDGRPYGVDVLVPEKQSAPADATIAQIIESIPQEHRDFVQKLLADAGVKPGTKLTHTVGNVANLVPAAQVFQAQLTRVGIDLQLEVLDWPAYIKRQRASDYTSTNTNFFPKVDPDDAYYRYFHSKGGANELSGGYANPAADKLLGQHCNRY